MCHCRISGRVLILDALLIPAYSTIHIVFCHVLALDLIKASWQLELQLENNVQKQRKPYHENEIVQVLVFSVFSWLAPVMLHCIESFYMTQSGPCSQSTLEWILPNLSKPIHNCDFLFIFSHLSIEEMESVASLQTLPQRIQVESQFLASILSQELMTICVRTHIKCQHSLQSTISLPAC